MNVDYKAQPRGASHVRDASFDKQLPPPRALPSIGRKSQSTMVDSKHGIASSHEANETAGSEALSRSLAAEDSTPVVGIKAQAAPSQSQPQGKPPVRVPSDGKRFPAPIATMDSNNGLARLPEANPTVPPGA